MEHEKLNCYRNLLSLAEELARTTAGWKRGNSDLRDQIRRAIVSAILNLAEGNGKRKSGKDRQRFFQIAMGSITEVAAGLDLAGAFMLLKIYKVEEMKNKLRLCYYQIRKLP